MLQNNKGVLPFYTRRDHKLKNRSYSNGESFAFVTRVNSIPPINIVRSGDGKGRAILSAHLTNLGTGVRTEITTEIQTVGLSVVVIPGADYDIIWFPASLSIPVSGLGVGTYELEIYDGFQTYYSADICMKDNLNDYIKIRFCHPGNLDAEGGSLYYNGVNENYLYILSDISKPRYEYVDDEIEQRDGVEFARKMISFKTHRFSFIASEAFLDVFRLIRLHKTVIIEYKNETYEVDAFTMEEPSWIKYGTTAEVEALFQTDTVVRYIGKGYDDASPCKPDGTNCVTVDHEVGGLIIEGSDGYNNGYIEVDGNRFYLIDGSKVLIATEPLGLIYPFTYNAADGSYSLIPNSDYDVAYATRTDLYYQKKPSQGFLPFGVTSYTPDASGTWTVFGNSFASGLIIEVVLYEEGGNQYLAGAGLSDDLETTGITFTKTGLAYAVALKAGNIACGYFTASNWYYFEGFNFEAFGLGSFKDDPTGGRPSNQTEITDAVIL